SQARDECIPGGGRGPWLIAWSYHQMLFRELYMRLKLKRIALVAALAALATQTSTAANVQDMSKVMTLLDRWQQVATPQGSESAVWRDMMRIQLEQVSPATLDRLLAIGAGAKRQSLGEFYGTFINTIGSDIQARLGAQKGQTQKAPESAA